MKKLFIAAFIVSVSVVLSGQSSTGFELNIKISGLEDSTVYLAYHLGDKQYIKDTIKLDNTGSGKLSSKEVLPMGIYMIVLPGRNYFEILISEDQVFGISCSYADYFNTLKFNGSEENSAFIEYQKKWIALQKSAGALSKRLQNNKQNTDSLKILAEVQKKQEATMKQYLKNVVEENGENLLATLVKAMLPIEIPEYVVPSVVANRDSARWVWTYNYNKNHFFDNVDLTDERLLRTPILQARLNAFFTNILIQSPDSINKEIDIIIRKCQSNYKVFQFISVYLFNHFRESEIMGHDAVMVKLADDIYLSGKADWVSKEFKEDLRKQVELIRPNLIGKKAENLIMDSYKGIFVSLDDIEKDFTVILFWEPDCGHCKEALPKLKAFYEKAKNESIEVFAVCTTSDKVEWSNYIEENKLTWINGWDPERKSHFDYYYNVQSTPLIYVLDKNKKIIAKKIGADDLASFIDNYRKYFR